MESSRKEHPHFVVYEKEPLLRFITWVKLTPVTLSVAFFFGISVTLCVWAALTGPDTPSGPEYISFFRSISWSLSILFLFPFVVGLSLKYYQEIPRVFDYLLEKVVESGKSEEIGEFRIWLKNRFNDAFSPAIFLIITLALSFIYYHQILGRPQYVGWDMNTSSELLQSIFGSRRGFTGVGLYGAIIQVVLLYWTFNLLWRGVIFAWGLHEFFNKRNFSLKIELLHPDGCCGLGRIGSAAMILNGVLFLLGIYVSLKVIDKMVIQKAPLGADIGNPIMLGAYAIVAPVLFFSQLGAAHYRMKEAKEEFLLPMSRRSEELSRELRKVELDKGGVESVQAFHEMEKMRIGLKKSIPVWPFDFKSLQAFVGTVVVPVVPVLLPLVFGWIFGQ